MEIDRERVQAILDRFDGLDSAQSHYSKDSVSCELLGPLVPDTASILREAFKRSDRVLDVGCGDGRTLLANAHLFSHGTGFDQSEHHMIRLATENRKAQGIENVDFVVAKSVEQPFRDEAFDLVYSERGPLGLYDVTVLEALRVLKPGGYIFLETPGRFDRLVSEKERFERCGVKIEVLCAREQTFVYPDFYEFLLHEYGNRKYMEQELPSADDTERLLEMLRDATDAYGRITRPYPTLWIGGEKIAPL